MRKIEAVSEPLEKPGFSEKAGLLEPAVDSLKPPLPVVLCLIGVLCSTAFSSAATAAGPADLVLRSGHVATVDPVRPQAEAVAVRGERIIDVGTDAEIKRLIGPETRVIDLQGRLAIPGFIEGHGHFVSLGRSLMELNLRSARDWEEIVEKVAQAARNAKPGKWIVGRGWHQEHWKRPPKEHRHGYPLHDALSRATPENPVLLTHGSGHACLANAKAMELAGVTARTPDPAGGEIMRDAAGRLTGVFRETAQGLIRRAHARARAVLSAEQLAAEELKAIELATRECLSKGVTSFQDAGSSFATVDRFKRLAEEGRLGVRLYVMLREPNSRLRERMAKYRMIGYGRSRLTVRAIKRMADGALGSHGALLLEPYADLPGSTGLRVESLETIQETAILAARGDFQLCVHAIGDRANREVLDLFDRTFRSFPEKKDCRWRIEHAQHLHPADISRFAELGVIASMQAVHATSDGPFVVARLGRKRAESGAYAWRSLLDAGATVSGGTDAPVEDVDPIACFYASVTRKLADGTPFFPEQRMTRAEALKSYTLDAAFAAFEEKTKGSLTPGKLADIVVLSKNILTAPESELRKARVDLTIVGGKIVFERRR